MDNPPGTRKWNRYKAHQERMSQQELDSYKKYLKSLDANGGGNRAGYMENALNACQDAAMQVWAEDENESGNADK